MNLYRLGLSWTTLKPALTILGTLGPILNTIRPLDPLGLLCTPLECSLAPYTTSLDQTNLYPLRFHLGSLWLSLTTLIILGPASNLLAPLKCLWTKENLYRGLLFMSQKFSWATTPISKWECYDFYAHIQVCFEKLQEVVWIKPITWQLSTYSATLLWHKQRTSI